ncbi:MAG: hypothetical protein ACRDP9_00280 [Kribbellaceae bacterium]
MRLYITPVLGGLAAGKLDAELLESFYARLQRCRDLCGGRRRPGHECRPLSGSTVRKIHYIISAAPPDPPAARRVGADNRETPCQDPVARSARGARGSP